MNEIYFPKLWDTYLIFSFYCIEYVFANKLKSFRCRQLKSLDQSLDYKAEYVCIKKMDKLIDFSFCG